MNRIRGQLKLFEMFNLPIKDRIQNARIQQSDAVSSKLLIIIKFQNLRTNLSC